jgi:GntR family transcriptional regulator
VFAIDASDPTPLYAQLERAIRLAVATGRLRPGDKLPTVRQLAVDLRINANTVAKVYSELERTGVLSSRRGVGTFIDVPGSHNVGFDERERELTILADRFLGGAAGLGYSAEQAVHFLKTRCKDLRREKSDA